MRKLHIGLLAFLIVGCSLKLLAELNSSANGVMANAGTAVFGHFIVDSGTVTTVSTVTAVTGITNALPAGTNLLGKTGIDQTTAGTTNGVVDIPTIVAADAMSAKAVTANTAQSVKASAGNVYAVSFQNPNASVCWLQFYNTAGSPTCGTAVIWSMVIPASGTLNTGGGHAFQNHATGIGFCAGTTATGATACTTALNGTIFYK